MSIIVRKASGTDINDFFYWRNHKETRPMLKNTELIPWEKHKIWYLESLKNSNKELLVCSLDENKIKIGSVGFNIDDNKASVSIIVEPKMRKKGLSALCLKKSINFFRKKHQGIELITAEIKETNIKSLKIFEKVGFKLKNNKNEFLFYELKL